MSKRFLQTCSGDNSIEWTMFRPTGGAVVKLGNNIVIAQLVEDFSGLRQQPVNSLNGIDTLTNARQYGSLIPGTCTNFKNPLVSFKPQELGHLGNNVGLGNRLTGGNRQRIIPIGPGPHGIFYKKMARHCTHRLKGLFIVYTARPELIFDHSGTAGSITVNHFYSLASQSHLPSQVRHQSTYGRYTT